MQVTTNDTILGSMRGISATMHSNNPDADVIIHNYAFLIGDKMYSITTYPISNPTINSQEEITKLLSNLHFTIDRSKRKPAFSTDDVDWRRMGKLAADFAFLAIIIIVVIITVVKRNKRKPQ